MTRRMTGAPMTMRLVSGVFYTPALLSDGMSGLSAKGFRRRDMCFVGTKQALANLRVGMAGAPRRLRSIYSLSATVDVMGTAGVLLETLETAAQCERENGFHSDGLLAGLFERFREHICGNAIVLTVSAADPRLLQSGSLILLQHSAHSVQTHEFTFLSSLAGSSLLPKGTT